MTLGCRAARDPAIFKAMTTIDPSPSTVSYESIKLGIDAHAKYYWVSRQVDGATPQPLRKMTYEELMLFVVKQQKLTRNVVTCYEAGAFGFHLHRRFEELGIKNYVVQPQDWDERGKGVKNDRLDAAALCQPSRKKAVVAIARQLAVDCGESLPEPLKRRRLV